MFSSLWVTEHYKMTFNQMLKTVRSAYVLVHLGYYKKMPQTGCLINNTHLFPTVPETEKSKIKVPANRISDKNPFPGSKMATFCCVLMRWKGRTLVCSVLYKGTNPSWGFHSHDLITSIGPMFKYSPPVSSGVGPIIRGCSGSYMHITCICYSRIFLHITLFL